MTLEELEQDPSSKFIVPGMESPSHYETLVEPLWVGKWKCKGCEVWIDGEPGKLCKWCQKHQDSLIDAGLNPHGTSNVEMERLKNEVIEQEGFLPKHIFQRVNEEGKLIYCMISEDGRVVDLDDY